MRGFATHYIVALVGAALIIGAALYTQYAPAPEAPPIVAVETDSVSNVPATEAPTTPAETRPKTSQPAPSTPKPTQTKTSTPIPAPAPSPEPTITPAPQPTPDPEPAPAPAPAYAPGFLASARITSEIPSESQRAMLPACDGRKFVLDPVNLNAVSSITANGASVLLNFSVTGTEAKFDVFAPGDVWVTNLIQQSDFAPDYNDTTIYFALCRDVFGYVMLLKEQSTQTHKMITDSVCFGKNMVGEGACKIEILEQVSVGSALGKAGRLGGSLGLGVIDLRTLRNTVDPHGRSIRENYAACPFDYFVNGAAYRAKFAGSAGPCAAP